MSHINEKEVLTGIWQIFVYKISPCSFAEKCLRTVISILLNYIKSDNCSRIDHSIKHSAMLFCRAEPFLDVKLIKEFFGGKLLNVFSAFPQKLLKILVYFEVPYSFSKVYLKSVFYIALISL